MALRGKKNGSKGSAAYDWANLPCDIIAYIFEHLDDYRIDQRRAASVCVAWRRAGSLLNFKKPSIIKLPFIGTCPAYNDIANSLCRITSITPNSLYFFISPALYRTQTRVWLIRVEEIGTNKWLLHPPSSWDHQEEYNFNLVDQHKILGVAKVYLSDPLSRPRVRKVISIMSDLGNRFLVLFGDKGKLALWSENSHQCSYIDTSNNYEFEDIINLRDQIYAIDTIGRLVIINPTTLDLVEVASSPKGIIIEYDVTIMYLVCSDGFLYLVYKGFVGAEAWWKEYTYFNRRHSWKDVRTLIERNNGCPIGKPKKMDVGVLMFDKQSRAWVRVENLGNKLFFITEYATFSLTAKQLGWSKGSFICFMCKDFHYGPDFGKDPFLYKVEGNVCRKQGDFHSYITVDFGRPPKWVRPMLHSTRI
ncbi:putative F-box protein At1g65770 [Silene latifolia]|uniref:putative F-box protein At1g65770 n=1 Tax=Silene latifolia TaxID=37657 RepID=UPI003D77B7CD